MCSLVIWVNHSGNDAKSYANWCFMILFVLGCIGVITLVELAKGSRFVPGKTCGGRETEWHQSKDGHLKFSGWWICCWCDWLCYWTMPWTLHLGNQHQKHIESIVESVVEKGLGSAGFWCYCTCCSWHVPWTRYTYATSCELVVCRKLVFFSMPCVKDMLCAFVGLQELEWLIETSSLATEKWANSNSYHFGI